MKLLKVDELSIGLLCKPVQIHIAQRQEVGSDLVKEGTKSAFVGMLEAFSQHRNGVDFKLQGLPMIHVNDRRELYNLYVVDPQVVSPGEPTPEKTWEELHATGSHPDYEYTITTGQRKRWDHADTPPTGYGWERNLAMGRSGWERFDYHEESYWRRKKP